MLPISNPVMLSAGERATLAALCAAFAPPPDMSLVDLIDTGLADTPPHLRTQFRLLLRLLGSAPGNLILGGRAKALGAMTDVEAQAYLRSLGGSRVALKRSAYHALKHLATFLSYAAHARGAPNPNWAAIGYPGPPTPPEPVETRITPLTVSEDTRLAAEVCVIGSGAGGSVVAAMLAAAGRDVLLMEKGGYYDRGDYTGDEHETLQRVSVGKGLFATDDNSIGLFAGIGLGGTTVINWTTSLEPPANILEEWERVHGIDGLTGAAFRADLESVTARLAVGTAESVHNANNRVLVEGATALGHEVRTLPRNVQGCGDGSRCGPCVYGCPWGSKRDALQTWVRDAASSGARILVHCEAQRLVARHGTVTGVEAVSREPATGARHRVEVRAKMVVLAGGAIFSPALLLRSGLGNDRVGTGLRLHPVTACLGLYDRPIEIWKGPAQTAVVTTHARSHHGTHGFWLEAAPGHPGIGAMAVPWQGREAHGALMRRLAHTSALIVLVRDVGGGRVAITRQGDPVVRYRLTPSDQALMISGLQELGRIHLAAGAQEVYSLHTAGARVGRDEPGAAGRFADAVARAGIRPNTLAMFSAHLMGGLPMGAAPARAAVDPSGRLYGATNLYVADGSVFPSAPAVNPMITIMAMARRIAARIP